MPAMWRNIRLLIAYEGTEFHGWQRQPELRTVQSVIEQAVRRVARHQVVLTGAGRTDAGVHAMGQVANFFTNSDIPAIKLFRAIGSRLPKDLTLRRADDVPITFHAQRSALNKLYRYSIHNAPGRPAEHRRHRYTYHFWEPLDLDAMREAARHMIGRRDFAALAGKGHQCDTTVRTVRRCDIARQFQEVVFDVIGDGFLYNQVRNMVGTLLEVGRGHWAPERIAEIMASGERQNAGPTAPARGLCMQWIRYDMPALRRAAEEDEPAEDDKDASPDGTAADGTHSCASAT